MNQEKVVFITGATGGIGKAAAIAMAQRQYTVVIHGRNKERTAAVAEEIKKLTGNRQVDYIVGDFFLMREVKKAATSFLNKYKRLDILINNAGGLMNKERAVTAEGIETTIALNVLAPFLLTKQLLPLLQQREDARIINVASNAHKLNARPDFNDIELHKHYNPLRAYGNSKLFLIWNTQHLAAQLSQQGLHHVRVNSVHPGAIATNFGVTSNLGGLMNVVAKLLRPFFKTPEQGAETLTFLATGDIHLTGTYFEKNKPVGASPKYYSKRNEQLIWDYCEQQVKQWK
ncbi:NAD(P)-dependent dehydrogenase, short-chain alcohol dehydrogenase family [Chitinophaga jiangningensis]|uniref:NAD(P)-dependent dehydrogenase, short-chain alcohol dehydrogenase family n=1 Tax=Chitinophaga jiangningensis TaxID=1419482 RepID=A0A1M7JT67_9BACT|nr:SDR family NAD(P)-dependent oxidoreductase [Chitinophaga jiangningensis]SHM56111.1 NAD(P)-dependent dehydrogenase, short-chain alcohol dehydrogenase family [Chitinophaga jiangningensis]